MSTLTPSVSSPAFIAPGESSSAASAPASFSDRPSPSASLPPGPGASPEPVLITGGAGFIGCHLADQLLSGGRRVRIFDNLSRPGVERNISWLRARHGDRLQLRLGDMRDPHAVEAAVRGVGPVFHLAGQVAVGPSLADPMADFDINARGTLNLLESIRRSPRRHGLVFASTHKVYGVLDDIRLSASDTRYEPVDPAQRHGVDESRPVSFTSPHGCSKGAADHYVLDYARTFGLPAVVFRLGCVYGPRQCGSGDRGWIAHFLLRALSGRPVTIFGDGRQVRDALHIDDLVDAFLCAQDHMARISGRAYNIGGGPAQATSLLEFFDLVRELHGSAPPLEFAGWRAADPRHYVSDIRRFCTDTGWSPRVGLSAGVTRLHRWLVENPSLQNAELAGAAA